MSDRGAYSQNSGTPQGSLTPVGSLSPQGSLTPQDSLTPQGSLTPRVLISPRGGGVVQGDSVSPADYMRQASPLQGNIYREREGTVEQYSENRGDLNKYGNRGLANHEYRTSQDDANYQRTHPVLHNLTNKQNLVATVDNGRTSESTSVSSTSSGSTPTAQPDSKQESFLQRATKFFQQQFQLDIKLPSDKATTGNTPQEQSTNVGAVNTTEVVPQSTVDQVPSQPKSSPIVTQQLKGISPYRQMPVVARDSLGQQQLRGSVATQNYLQPPNLRGHRKTSDSRILSQNQGESSISSKRRVSAAARMNKSATSGESGSSSPNVTRKQRALPSTAGRQQIGMVLIFHKFYLTHFSL